MMKLRCPNVTCLQQTTPSSGMVIRFGSYQTRWGSRRRFQCKGCGRTFCGNRGTVYHRLQHRRSMFDQVAALSVEGVNKSAIDRVQSDRLEHGGSLVGKSCCLLSSIQP